MATKLDPIIWGKDKSITYSKISLGDLAKAVSDDLEEFGEKGVQGVKLGSNLDGFLKYEKAGKRAKDGYFMLGVHSNGSLCLVLRDKKDDKFEAIEIAVKGYDAIKEKLAKSSAKVVNISPDKNEEIIKGASEAQGDKFKTPVSNDNNPDFGGITGNVILCAHGRPDVVPSGRVIGDEFGHKTPEQIVDLLIGDKSAAKRIGKDYSGKITLSGCFTASGGPERFKQDDPFAAKVLSILRKKGYNSLSVVGMPGPSITARKDDDEDSSGEKMKRGDKHVQVNQSSGKELEALEKHEQEEKKLLKAVEDQADKFNKLVEPRNQANNAYKSLMTQFNDAKKNTKLKPEDFVKAPETIELGKKIAAAKKTFEERDAEVKTERAEYDKRKKAYDDKVEEIKKTGLRSTMAKVTGNFGLRVLN